MKVAALSTGLALGIAGGALLDTLFRTTRDGPLLLFGKTTSGIIQDFDWEVDVTDAGQTVYHGSWEFEYRVNGKLYKGYDYGSIPGTPRPVEEVIGSEAPIRYLALNPNTSALASQGNTKWWGFLIGALVVYGFGITLARVFYTQSLNAYRQGEPW